MSGFWSKLFLAPLYIIIILNFDIMATKEEFDDVIKLLVQKEKVHIFCKCRTIDDGRCVVEFSKCQKWYHAECVTKTLHDEN